MRLHSKMRLREIATLTAPLATAASAAVALAAALAAPATASGQTDCEPVWSAVGGGVGGGDFPVVHALAVFDNGSGPALYVGGRFVAAGGVTVNGVARWDGEAWSPLGSGVDMSCPAPCPPPGVVALAVFDDGSGGGPALYAGGLFDTAGGEPANCIAKWDGAEWLPLGSGTNSTVIDMAVFDDGSGPALYAAGLFREAGGTPAQGIAKWDGAEWSAVGGGVGGGVSPWVYALAEFDDGSGPALYAGGSFETAGGVPANRIAKWDGAAWSALAGGGTGGPVYALTVFDDGAGSALYAGGQFLFADRIAKWDGAAWSPLGSGMSGGDPPRVWALGVFDDDSGAGPALYAGGQFITAGGVTVNSIARWDGAAWSAMDGGMGGGNPPSVSALTVFDDGAGPALYVGGAFTTAGATSVSNIAKWGCPACYPDCDGDGDLTFFDFLCFQNKFAAQTPYADCDASGAHDFFDFLCFQNAFAAGCD